MNSFLSISLWIALTTIVPGMMTIATVFGAIEISGPEKIFLEETALNDNFIWLSISIGIMIITQAFGILLEMLLIKYHLYGKKSNEIEIKIPKGVVSNNLETNKINPYIEYDCLYLLIVKLRENEDSQGHLKRCVSQFFLSNNSLISFIAGILTSIILMVVYRRFCDTNSWIYLVGLILLLFTSYRVARIRFQVMAKAIWATRIHRNLN